MNDQKPFDGLEFVFTGQLDSISRAQAQEAVRSLGGTVMGRVGPSTSYVVVGSNTGRKRDHARILGVEELSEDQFLRMLSSGTSMQ